MVEKSSLGPGKGLLLVLMAGLLGLVNTAWAQAKNLEKSFPTVVMIEGKQNGTTSFGAGIVIGARAGRIYIATARHVVKSGRTAATDIKVKFKFLPGEKYEAKLLEHPGTDLDLTVLSVSTAGDDIPVSEFNFKVLGDSGQLKRRSDVYPLGNPSAKAWGVALNPEKVDTIKGSVITFQSSYIQKGHSGGALLDGCGDIVGLIVRDSPPNGEALRMESVMQELKSWGFPVNIEKSGGCVPTSQENSPGEQANTETNDPQVLRKPVTDKGSISIRYTGDAANCAINIEILLVNNNRVITPTGNLFNVNDLNLGQEYYEIEGMISCGVVGSCFVSAEDSIFLQQGNIYDIVWQTDEFGQCYIALSNMNQ